VLVHQDYKNSRDTVLLSILNYGSPLDELNEDGETVLHHCCSENLETELELLLARKEGRALLEIQDKNGQTPLLTLIKRVGAQAVWILKQSFLTFRILIWQKC
jgi:ankyrin repeat protein